MTGRGRTGAVGWTHTLIDDTRTSSGTTSTTLDVRTVVCVRCGRLIVIGIHPDATPAETAELIRDVCADCGAAFARPSRKGPKPKRCAACTAERTRQRLREYATGMRA